MIQTATGIMISYLITFFLLPFVIKIARVNKLYDVPDERKTHTDPISSLGGIGIFFGLMLSLLLVSDFKTFSAEFQYYLAAFFVIFIMGVIDDIFVLTAWKKVFGQFAVAIILTLKAHLLITNLHGFMGVYALSEMESHIITFFSIILIINSFNLIDGVDGLAASLGLFSCILFGLFFLLNNNIAFALLGFSMSGALLAFLIYNFPPARIFMGDSGSTLLGLVNAVLIIKFVETANTAESFAVHSAPAIGFGILLIPLMDVLRVFVLRLVNKKSPIAPDRNHLHHVLLNKAYTHTRVTITILIFALLFAAVSFLMQNLNINIIVTSQFALFFAGVFLFKRFLPARNRLHIVTGEMEEVEEEDDDDDVKVYTIYRPKEKVSINEE